MALNSRPPDWHKWRIANMLLRTRTHLPQTLTSPLYQHSIDRWVKQSFYRFFFYLERYFYFSINFYIDIIYQVRAIHIFCPILTIWLDNILIDNIFWLTNLLQLCSYILQKLIIMAMSGYSASLDIFSKSISFHLLHFSLLNRQTFWRCIGTKVVPFKNCSYFFNFWLDFWYLRKKFSSIK